MVQPIRPQDVSGLYRQQAATTARPGAAGAPGAGDAPGGAAGGARGGRRSDRVMLSDEARQLRRVLDSLDDVPEVREQRVAELRAQIADGTYDRGLRDVATRIMQDAGLA